MKSLALFAAICAVGLSAGTTKPANAATLVFDFSFSNAVGIVTGGIDGLSDNRIGPGPAVILDSFPISGPICSVPCNTTVSPWIVGANVFTVSNGKIVGDHFMSKDNGMFFTFNGSNGSLLSAEISELAGPVTSRFANF